MTDWASVLAISACVIFFVFVIYKAMPEVFHAIGRFFAYVFGYTASKGSEVVGEVTTYG